jgi:hypothetical protein
MLHLSALSLHLILFPPFVVIVVVVVVGEGVERAFSLIDWSLAIEELVQGWKQSERHL